jgi:hypothetical protein
METSLRDQTTMRCFIAAVASSSILWCAEASNFCQPPPEIERALQDASAASAAVTDPFAALDRAAPFQAVRDRYPDNLFAHERYQDAIQEYGIEGHMRLLARQYTELESKHAGDPMYRYLWLRATVGRSTAAAIKGLEELVADNPGFAPAHGTLAEIYGAEAYRDSRKEQSEKANYTALCPGGTFINRPPPLPRVTPLLDQAERLLAAGGDPDRIIETTKQGIMELEWRSQRIRAFDWYSLDYKRQDARQLRAAYWQAWSIQVHCHRKAGRGQSADELLASMEQQAPVMRKNSESAYWDAIYMLAHLYVEGHEAIQANQKLNELRQLAADNPDPTEKKLRAGRIEKLRKMIAEESR